MAGSASLPGSPVGRARSREGVFVGRAPRQAAGGVRVITLRLPVDSDLAVCSVQWAAQILGETPRMLWVTHEDDDYAREHFGDIEIGIDETLERDGWILEGSTKQVYS